MLSGMISVLLLILFVLVCVWVWRPSLKSSFDQAARLPLEDEAGAGTRGGSAKDSDPRASGQGGHP